TDSAVGRRVLDDFEALLPRFVKVFPADYKRVLAEWAREEEQRNQPAVSTGGEGFVSGENEVQDG
ncbi:MAG: hypothetical protein ABIO51_06795, partial [Solirubrobacteraceae bacterium]